MDIELKSYWQSFHKVLVSNGVNYLYHFTDARNIPSIKKHGGLYSWYYCQNHNIRISNQGGNDTSMELDRLYGLEDYVRLSFCEDHPMAYRLKKAGCDVKVLIVKIDAALLKGTLYCDMNAADSGHTAGPRLEDLKRINFAATKKSFITRFSKDFKAHQAEVLVKTFVPLEYILNI